MTSVSNPTDSALARACTGLWSATLLLMTAYMQTPAPAHRLLLARRIAGNFKTLAQQEETFSQPSRDSFLRLQRRWQATAERLAGPFASDAGSGLLERLLPFRW